MCYFFCLICRAVTYNYEVGKSCKNEGKKYFVRNLLEDLSVRLFVYLENFVVFYVDLLELNFQTVFHSERRDLFI